MTRVLVVDDDPQVLKLLRVNFELEGYDVIEAASGQEAIRAARTKRPDVIVCDVMMPGMDGFEVLEQLRADPKTADLPVVLCSAKAQRSDVVHGERSGADAYVTKPFDPQDLLDTVERVLANA
ncbi:MAG: response regulator [Actinomycetota bacterium]